MITNSSAPKRGEIWLTNFDPTIGAEIKKIRPAVIVSSDSVGKLPIKLIAPITDWKEYFINNIWHIKLEPDNQNNLTKDSAIDVLQLRGVDTQRFIRKIGQCSPEFMEEVAAAIAAVIDYD
ncbi:MAG TPA: type II toxin-antitoxin system PemK/MazF family toxin [Nostocaceae cyanobacterium]|nr:type II toxin-antitoxin system PemK/MazF family toxin [Nostocaceae cyanobacterium]